MLPVTRALLPVLPTLGPVCVTFAYNMYGFHIGTLQVVKMIGTQETDIVWSLSGQQSESSIWFLTNVTVPALLPQEQVSDWSDYRFPSISLAGRWLSLYFLLA